MRPRDEPLLPRASIADVVRGRARVVGSRTRVGRDALGLPPGLISPYEARAAMGLRYGDPPIEEARHERTRSLAKDASAVARWLVASLAGAGASRRAEPSDRAFVVSARVDPIDTHEATDRILSWLRRRECGQVFFVHPHALNLASNSAELRDDLAAARLVLPDGIGIRIAAAMLGVPFPANVNGTDLIPELLLELSAERVPIALIGGDPGVAARAAEAWSARTGVRVLGVWDGFRRPEDYEEIRRTIGASAPCVVLIGMGSPKQERFARQWFADAPGVVAITVGGLFDFASGGKRRAPLAFRELGLEWLWRLGLEPRRLGKRYLLGNPAFLLRAARQRLTRRDDERTRA